MTGVIKGTGASVPSRILENKELENLVETSGAWIQERTGIERRHIAVRETTVSMAAEAAAEALKEARLQPEQIDMILDCSLYGSQSSIGGIERGRASPGADRPDPGIHHVPGRNHALYRLSGAKRNRSFPGGML